MPTTPGATSMANTPNPMLTAQPPGQTPGQGQTAGQAQATRTLSKGPSSTVGQQPAESQGQGKPPLQGKAPAPAPVQAQTQAQNQGAESAAKSKSNTKPEKRVVLVKGILQINPQLEFTPDWM
jgi:hypothetical protein